MLWSLYQTLFALSIEKRKKANIFFLLERLFSQWKVFVFFLQKNTVFEGKWILRKDFWIKFTLATNNILEAEFLYGSVLCFSVKSRLSKEIYYMKATGIVRRIDDLGRVVIPKEIRRTMRIREGDPTLTMLTPLDRFCFAMMEMSKKLGSDCSK